MTDRTFLQNEITSARTELARLRDERTRLQCSDREGAKRLREQIGRAAEDVQDLETELADFDTLEASATRVAQRADGRDHAAKAVQSAHDDLALWKTLHTQLTAARNTAKLISEQGQIAASHVASALAAHDSGASHGAYGLAVPLAAASDSGTVEAVACEIKTLIESLPGAHRIASEWISLNAYAFTRATPGGRPSMVEARRNAAASLRARLAPVCSEPAPVDTTRQRALEAADERLVSETFGGIAA